jgi:guanylate kinase
MPLLLQETNSAVSHNKAPPYLIVISAPSGGGKTTLCQRLLKDFPSLSLSISSTTRAPRGNERDGIEYFFLSREEFENRIRDHRFAEWAVVHGNYYGTSKEMIDQAFAAQKSVLLDIDVQGAGLLHQAYPNQCHRIFIAPPSIEELEFRLRARGTDSEQTIQKRITNAKAELAESKKFNSIVINDSLERAYQELKGILEKELQLKAREEMDG